jgi:hypothetical protein
MISILEGRGFFEIRSALPIGKRFFFLLIALIPLLAPYELIMRPDWQSYLNIPFLFALVVSLGALLVSGLLMWAAIAGLDSKLRLDRHSQTLTHASRSLVLPWRTSRYPLSAVSSLEIEEHDWSDGDPTYSIVALLTDGTQLTSGSSRSREELEAIVMRATAYMGR